MSLMSDIANAIKTKLGGTTVLNTVPRYSGTTAGLKTTGLTIDDNNNILGNGNQSFNGFGGTGLKNYIINGKKAVNQCGLTSTDNAYNYDIHYKSGNNWYLPIEGDNNLISGQTYTLSWVGAATASYYVGTATSSTINAQTFTSIANGGTIALTISAGQNLWIKFASDATGSTYNYVQLEKGTIATPFEHLHYNLELNRIVRYYENSFATGAVPGTDNLSVIQTGYFFQYDHAGGGTILYSRKRVTPTVNIYASLTTSSAGKVRNASNGTINTVSGIISTQVATAFNVDSGTAIGYQCGFVADARF